MTIKLIEYEPSPERIAKDRKYSEIFQVTGPYPDWREMTDEEIREYLDLDKPHIRFMEELSVEKYDRAIAELVRRGEIRFTDRVMREKYGSRLEEDAEDEESVAILDETDGEFRPLIERRGNKSRLVLEKIL